MLAARIQPTYLTNVCQVGFKKCIVTNDMDFCAHLLHDCIGTGTFTQPPKVELQEKAIEPPLSFTDRENEINQLRCKKKKFYAMFFQIIKSKILHLWINHAKDRFICRHLCSQSLVMESTRNKAFSSCEKICFELTRSYYFAGEVCPFEKYCSTGCPCRFYQCEKVENEQTLVPVWDLTESRPNRVLQDLKNEFGLITNRLDVHEGSFRRFPIVFSNLHAKNETRAKNLIGARKNNRLFPHECFQ